MPLNSYIFFLFLTTSPRNTFFGIRTHSDRIMATEHITRTGDEYNVELLPSDDDAPPLESSWRLNLDAFQLPSSTGGRHDGRTRFSRYFRTPSNFFILLHVFVICSQSVKCA